MSYPEWVLGRDKPAIRACLRRAGDVGMWTRHAKELRKLPKTGI